MGLIDLPAPVFQWVDAWLAVALPPLARIIGWGALSGLASMWLYAVISPQSSIAEGKQETAEARRALDACDGDWSEAAPLMRRLLGLSLKQIRLTLLPATLASLPLLMMLAWMSTTFGASYPASGVAPMVEVKPAQFQAHWVEPAAAGNPPHVLITDANGQQIADLPLKAPVQTLHPRQWWNVLLANPAGYLPQDSAVTLLQMNLPRQHFMAFGPVWLRGWEFPFFTALLLGSLGLKVALRIQ